VPSGGLLIGVGHLQDGLFCEWAAANLQADWEPFRVEAAVDRHGRSAGQIEGPGHHRRQSGGHFFGSDLRVGSSDERGTGGFPTPMINSNLDNLVRNRSEVNDGWQT